MTWRESEDEGVFSSDDFDSAPDYDFRTIHRNKGQNHFEKSESELKNNENKQEESLELFKDNEGVESSTDWSLWEAPLN